MSLPPIMPAPIAPGRSIKTRITVTMLAIFLGGIWSLTFYASELLRSDLQAILGAHQQSIATSMAARVQGEVDARTAALRAVAQELVGAHLADGAKLRKVLSARPVLLGLFDGGVVIVGSDGTVLAEMPPIGGRTGSAVLHMDGVRNALERGKVGVGQPFTDPTSGVAMVAMAVPINGSTGQVIGAMVGLTTLTQSGFLDRIMHDDFDGVRGYRLITTLGDHWVIAASDSNRVMQPPPNTHASPALHQAMQGQEGTQVLVNPQGVEVLSSVCKLPRLDWLAVVALPTTLAFAPIRDMQNHVILAAALLTLLAVGLTWWMLYRQLKPVLDTARVLAAMSASNQPLRLLPVVRRDEIGQLIAGFNRLLASLTERTEALRQNEEKLTTILDNVDACIYLKDTQGCYLYGNRKLRERFAVPMAALVGHGDEVFLDASSAAQVRATDQTVLVTGQTLRAEVSGLALANGKCTSVWSVKIALRDQNGVVYALCGIATDITPRKQAEAQLRIAAIAFECQEGMAVMDPQGLILRVNRAFTLITGYTEGELQFKNHSMLRSDRLSASVYEGIWATVRASGSWQGDAWQRRKDGQDYPAHVTLTAVCDEHAAITHFVCNITDTTHSHLQEQKRLADEAAHRDALVREVHHRIKNNLQGIIGVLRQSAQQHPETAEPIEQAIGKVQSISITHGLRGQTTPSSVQLCELVQAVATEVGSLWQTPVAVQLSQPWHPCVLAETEAVPMALVLNELIQNAVKHGGKAHGDTHIDMGKLDAQDEVQITIRNTGTLPGPGQACGPNHNGLQLVQSLLPHQGVVLKHQQVNEHVHTVLRIYPPVIALKESL